MNYGGYGFVGNGLCNTSPIRLASTVKCKGIRLIHALNKTRGFSAALRLTSLSSKGEGRGPCSSASFGGHVTVRSWPGIYDIGSSVDEVCSVERCECCGSRSTTLVEEQLCCVCPRWTVDTEW